MTGDAEATLDWVTSVREGLKEVQARVSKDSDQYSSWASFVNMPANQLWLAQME